MAERSASPTSADATMPGGGAAGIDLSALVVAHHAPLYRYAYRLCGCQAEAEDLTQQAFLVAQQKLHQLREAERAAGWLFAVLRSCFLKSLRKQRPASGQAFDIEVEDHAVAAPEGDDLDREQLAAALAELPDDYRLVVLMFYFEDLSYQEIAHELEIPIGTVMSRLSRAKSHLRRRLTPPDDSPSSPESSNVARPAPSTEKNANGSTKSASRAVHQTP
ncbi:MAG: sigma-70 family RNA polymerase sigma factor [Pirellulaceae bacterium]|nr:sigma-70 family RNA polymerase sigma factor [Pirellulaceae bacterium]